MVNNQEDKNNYNGSFYWIIPSTIKKYMQKDFINLNGLRLSEILPVYTEKFCKYFPLIQLYPTNYYLNSTKILSYLLNEINDDKCDSINKYRDYLEYLNEETGLDIIDCTIENGGS